MKKKYHFKLEGLLKLRKLKEDQCKAQIGLLQVEISKRKKMIAQHTTEISEAYDSQQLSLEQGITGQDAQFYPYYMEGKREFINGLQNEIDQIQAQIDEKYLLLSKLRGDVKVIDKMKEKDKEKHKKYWEKREIEKIEEQVMNWKGMIK